MAQTFEFHNMSNSGSNLNLNNVNLDYHKPGDLIFSTRQNHSGIYSGNSASSRVGFTASVNGVPVLSNYQAALFGPNNGSNLGTTGTTHGGSSGSGGLSDADKINLGLAIAQFGYSIFNNERNYAQSQSAYADSLARDQRNFDLDKNGFLNLVEQYAKVGLNPLYASGNGTSVGSASQFSAPQHGSLDFFTTLSFMDKLKTSQVERQYLQAQANRQNSLTLAQEIVNEKNLASIEKILADKGFTFEKTQKTKEELNRLKQLIEITDYDFDITKTGKGMRYKDSTPEAIKIANTLAGYDEQGKLGNENNFFGAIGSTLGSILLNILKSIL